MIHEKDVKHIYNQLKSSATSRNIPFTITLTDLHDLTFPISCPIFNIPLVYNRGTPKDNSVSVDRMNSSKGYEPGNLEVISYRANRLKSDATALELMLLAEHVNLVVAVGLEPNE
jgi:hypothetical protein